MSRFSLYSRAYRKETLEMGARDRGMNNGGGANNKERSMRHRLDFLQHTEMPTVGGQKERPKPKDI